MYRILTTIPGRIRYELTKVAPAQRYQALQRLFVSWSKAALGLKRNAATIFKIDCSETELILLFEAGLEALRAYRPAPSPVPITLFRAKIPLMRHLIMDSTLGWKNLAQREVQVRVIPGDHQSMTTERLVRHLAKAIADELDKIENS